MAVLAAVGATLLSATGLAAGGAAATIGKLLLGGLAIAAQIFLTPRPKQPDPQDVKTTKESEEGPGRHGFGRLEVGGFVAFGNTARYDIHRLLFHCFGELDGAEEYIYDGRPIVVEENGDVSSPPWARPDGSYFNVETKVGDGTEVAFERLKTAYPDLWTDDHRAIGITQSLLTFTNPGTGSSKFGQLYTGGIKQFRVRVRQGKFFDPRDGQSRWTMNAALIALHYFRQLPSVVDADIDFEDIGETATACDELVPTATGTEPRSQLSGGGEGNITVQFVEALLESGGLEERKTAEGKRTFRLIEDYPDAERTYTERHIIDQEYQQGPEGARRPNVCRVKYFSELRQFKVAEIDMTGIAWARVENEIARYGEHELILELKFCPSHAQAQRIARRIFHTRRADIGASEMNFVGMTAFGLRTVDMVLKDFDETVRARISAPAVDDNAGRIAVPFSVIPAVLQTAFNPATDEAEAPPVLEYQEAESELDTPAAPTDAVTVLFPTNQRELRIRFSPVSGASIAEANYRTYTDGEPDLWAGMEEVGTDFAYVSSGAFAEPIDFRVRMFNGDEDPSYFSDLLQVLSIAEDNRAPSAPTGTFTQETTSEDVIFELTINAPDEIRISYIEIRRGDGFFSNLEETVNVRPKDVVTRSFSGSALSRIDYEITVHSSDGTSSPALTLSYIPPGP